MTPNEIPQPVLAKLFALQHHVEHCAKAETQVAAQRESARRLLSGEGSSPRSMQEHKRGQFDPQQLRAEFDALHAATAAARQRATTETAILTRCRSWIEQLPAVTLDQVAAKLDPGDSLQSVRARLAAIATEVRVLQSAPVPDPDLRKKVESYVERLAAAAEPDLRGIEQGVSFRALWPSDANSRRNVLSGVPGVSSFFDENAANAVLLAAWLSPGVLVDRLLAIATKAANEHCPVEERPARIAALNNEALRLRYAEEALVVKALAAGEGTVRDAAAPAEAVLQVRVRPNVKSVAKSKPAEATQVEPEPGIVLYEVRIGFRTSRPGLYSPGTAQVQEWAAVKITLHRSRPGRSYPLPAR